MGGAAISSGGGCVIETEVIVGGGAGGEGSDQLIVSSEAISDGISQSDIAVRGSLFYLVRPDWRRSCCRNEHLREGIVGRISGLLVVCFLWTGFIVDGIDILVLFSFWLLGETGC